MHGLTPFFSGGLARNMCKSFYRNANFIVFVTEDNFNENRGLTSFPMKIAG